MRTLAIGDIHGCHTALTALLGQIQPSPEDYLIFLGDYIDRGPASRAVIDSLIELEKTTRCVFLRGNHEAMILAARDETQGGYDTYKTNLWQSYGGGQMLVSYGTDDRGDWVSGIPQSHWEFFERTERFVETETDIFIHASADPESAMNEQPDWLLFWEHLDRLKPHQSRKRIICGHTPQRSGNIKDLGFALCIDTGPAVGGWLTCLDVETGNFWQANEQGQHREGEMRTGMTN
jgi:serine/threonine protein phosphatase 1